MLPEDPDTHRMKGRHPNLASTFPDQLVDTLPHLPGRLVCKRDGEDIPRTHITVFNEICDAMCEHAGLAGACARQNKKRSLCIADRLQLFFI